MKFLGYTLMFSFGAVFVFIFWNKFSIFLLEKRISLLEKEIGIKTDKYGDKCE